MSRKLSARGCYARLSDGYGYIRRCRVEKKYICCFTGHRKIAEEHTEALAVLLECVLERLICAGVHTYRAGGALGFDTLAALYVLEKKKKYPFLRLELCLPCENQAENWGEYDRTVYEKIKKHADSVRYAEKSYSPSCMYKRNMLLVDGAHFCVAYCTEEHGGTVFTYEYAEREGLRAINLAQLLQ